MWNPTHVQVIVQRARDLQIKGKHGANDAYVTIQLGKEKYQTSVQEKTLTPQWHEECELTIPDGNTSCITLAVFHRNFVGIDKFLGRVDIPLSELDVYERPRNKFYPLRGKPKKSATDVKPRGELEVQLAFVVKSVTGSLMDLTKKQRKTGSLPLKMVHSVGGSLMNLAGGKDKRLSLGHWKSSIGEKLSEKLPRKKSSKNNLPVEGMFYGSGGLEEAVDEDEQSIGDVGDFSDADAASTTSSVHYGEVPTPQQQQLSGYGGDVQSHVISTESIRPERPQSPAQVAVTPVKSETSQPPPKPPPRASVQQQQYTNNRFSSGVKTENQSPQKQQSQEQAGYTINTNTHLKSARRQTNSVGVTKEKSLQKNTLEQNMINERPHLNNLAQKELLALYEAMTKQELIEMLCKQRALLEEQQHQINDLEDYIDNLLARVMDVTPRLLQNPYRHALK